MDMLGSRSEGPDGLGHDESSSVPGPYAFRLAARQAGILERNVRENPGYAESPEAKEFIQKTFDPLRHVLYVGAEGEFDNEPEPEPDAASGSESSDAQPANKGALKVNFAAIMGDKGLTDEQKTLLLNHTLRFIDSPPGTAPSGFDPRKHLERDHRGWRVRHADIQADEGLGPKEKIDVCRWAHARAQKLEDDGAIELPAEGIVALRNDELDPRTLRFVVIGLSVVALAVAGTTIWKLVHDGSGHWEHTPGDPYNVTLYHETEITTGEAQAYRTYWEEWMTAAHGNYTSDQSTWSFNEQVAAPVNSIRSETRWTPGPDIWRSGAAGLSSFFSAVLRIAMQLLILHLLNART